MADWGVRVLALDLAVATGWACGDVERAKPRVSTLRLPSSRYDDQHLVYFTKQLRSIIQLEQVDLVYYEAPIPGGQMAGKTTMETVELLNDLVTLTRFVCASWRDADNNPDPIPAIAAHVGEVRKHFVGHGRPTLDGQPGTAKRVVMKRCVDLGVRPGNDNEADALAILSFALHQLKQVPPWARAVPLEKAA